MTSAEYPNSTTELGILLTPEQMERFLEKYAHLQETQSKYRYCLRQFYLALPEEKCIRRGTLEWWRDQLLADGYAPRSVNVNLSVVNAYLGFVGHREYQTTEFVPIPRETEQRSELTRDEYLRLLDTARALKKERLYLQIKTIICPGLSISDLLGLTVEMVLQGQVVCGDGQAQQFIRLPECLQKELLAYAQQQGRERGYVFVTRNGCLMNRSNVFRAMQQLCKEAQVAEGKGTPSCMKRLYQSTLFEVKDTIAQLIAQEMDKIVEEEQSKIGWQER